MLAGEAGAAADIKDHGRRVQGEKLQCTLSHGGLDGLDSGGGCVFVRFDVIVE